MEATMTVLSSLIFPLFEERIALFGICVKGSHVYGWASEPVWHPNPIDRLPHLDPGKS